MACKKFYWTVKLSNSSWTAKEGSGGLTNSLWWQYDNQHNNTQHNDTHRNEIQHNDTQRNDIQHNDTQHNTISILAKLSQFIQSATFIAVMLVFIMPNVRIVSVVMLTAVMMTYIMLCL